MTEVTMKKKYADLSLSHIHKSFPYQPILVVQVDDCLLLGLEIGRTDSV